MRKLRPRKIRSLPKVIQLESDRAKIPNRLPRQSGSRIQITPGVTPTAPRAGQTLWVIKLKSHPCGVFLWALHGHACAGRKGAPLRLAEGCKACHPRSGTKSSSPSGNTDPPRYLSNPSLRPPSLGQAIAVGGAKNLE